MRAAQLPLGPITPAPSPPPQREVKPAMLLSLPRLRQAGSPSPTQASLGQQAYQQRDIHAKREQTSYERKEEEWHKSDISTAKGGDVQGGNIDNWLAKQSNN